MFITATELVVVIDNLQDLYTNNDIIEGVVILRNRKPRSFLTLKASLRCKEIASVTVSSGKQTSEVIEIRHWLHFEQCVFPTSEMQAMSPTKSGKGGYTLQAGEHKFPFKFRFPPSDQELPPTCHVDRKSGIFWGIHAELEAPPIVVDRTMMVHETFEFQSSVPLPPMENDPQSGTLAKEIKVYLPGFSDWQQPLSAKLLNLVPQFSRFRTKTTVELTQIVPKNPVYQEHLTRIGVDLNISLSDPGLMGLLCITGIECRLKQKIIVRSGRKPPPHREAHQHKRPYREVHHNESVILRKDGIQWNLKEGTEKARDLLAEACIAERLPPSRSETLINVYYKLVLIVTIASEEVPKRSDKLRISTPISLQRFEAQRKAEESCPPEYAVHHLSLKADEK